VGLCLKKEVLGALAEWKSALEFFRVFTISTKVTNLALELNKGIDIELGWLYI
jgi:hypothetical protein